MLNTADSLFMLVSMNAKQLNKLTLEESLLADVMRRLESVNLKTTLEAVAASSGFNVTKTRNLLISMQAKGVVEQGVKAKRSYSLANFDCPKEDGGGRN